MVTQISINHRLYCLTLVIWPFTITAFTFRSCFCCTNVSNFKDGSAVNFEFFSQGDNRFFFPNESFAKFSQIGVWNSKVLKDIFLFPKCLSGIFFTWTIILEQNPNGIPNLNFCTTTSMSQRWKLNCGTPHLKSPQLFQNHPPKSVHPNWFLKIR